MINAVDVFLWGTKIGSLYQKNDRLPISFEYDKDFISSGIQPSPFMMPLSGKIYSFPGLPEESFHGAPGMIADSLPDAFGNAVIDKWLVTRGRKPDSFTTLERLCYTGKRGMGALEYVPSTGPDPTKDNIDITEMSELASEILSSRESAISSEKEMHLSQMLEVGSSAGGARAKALIAWNETTGEVKSGQIDAGEGFKYWLIKFDGVKKNGDHGIADPKQYTLIEYAYYKIACDLGINMTECRIYQKDGLKHFITERFDRLNNDKIHMQSFGALSHIDYNNPGLSGYELLADYASRLEIGQAGREQLFKRMTFNIIGMNCDDHVKNFSFLMDKSGNWTLSPAYDLTFAYAPGSRWLSGHQMTVAGKTNKITEEDLISCGKEMGLGVKFCNRIVSETKESFSKWLQYADNAGLSEERALEVYKGIKEAGEGRF